MNIKRRLIISNTVTVIIPLIITFVIGICFIFISSIIFNKDMSYNKFKEFTMIKVELLSASNNISKQKAEEVEGLEFKDYLSQRLKGLKGEFIITKGQEVIYSSKGLNKIDVEKTIEEVKTQDLRNTLEINDKLYLVQESRLVVKDGIEENVILLAPVGENLDIFRIFIIVIISVFVISFITVNLFMSYLFSKRILKPVATLKTAATDISSGNLQCEIIEEGDEEIRELCHEFEVMRIQLKDSIHMKMKYDDNRNMLVSSISHDLRTPITSIKGYVEGILDGVANTPEKMESYLKTIYSKTEHMDAMIDDLLLYSKLDLKQLPFNFEKTDILKYFKFCISESEPELLRSNIKIEIKSDLKDLRYVMVDRDRMRRVIMNIIDNSKKYIDKDQGEIIVMLRETSLSIIIEIRDNGLGIDKNDIDKIFDRFYRADTARSETTGSGLGLAIAKQIVEGHKGKIWVVSYGHEGTSILISLAKIIGEQREVL
jgi:signal transduction histidine kinase